MCRARSNRLERTNDMACIGSPDIRVTLEASKYNQDMDTHQFHLDVADMATTIIVVQFCTSPLRNRTSYLTREGNPREAPLAYKLNGMMSLRMNKASTLELCDEIIVKQNILPLRMMGKFSLRRSD